MCNNRNEVVRHVTFIGAFLTALLLLGASPSNLKAKCLSVASGEHYILQKDLTVECITIAEDGRLTIDPGYTLTLDGGESTIQGMLHVKGKLVGYGWIGGSGVVNNDGLVSANSAFGTMRFFDALTLQDSECASPRWCVFGDSAMLQMDVSATTLLGDLAIANGEFEVNSQITTSGRLLVGTDALVDINASMCVSEWKFALAPGQSGCGGTVNTADAPLRYDTFTPRSGCSSCSDPGSAVAGQCRDRSFNSPTEFTCDS